MVNSVLYTKNRNWGHGSYAKIMRVTTWLTIRFVCSRCKDMMEGTVDSIEKLCDEVNTMNEFCC